MLSHFLETLYQNYLEKSIVKISENSVDDKREYSKSQSHNFTRHKSTTFKKSQNRITIMEKKWDTDPEIFQRGFKKGPWRMRFFFTSLALLYSSNLRLEIERTSNTNYPHPLHPSSVHVNQYIITKWAFKNYRNSSLPMLAK